MKWEHLFINRNRDLIGRNQNIKTNTSQTCTEFEPFSDSSIINGHGPERWPVARSFPSITSNKDKWFSIFFSISYHFIKLTQYALDVNAINWFLLLFLFQCEWSSITWSFSDLFENTDWKKWKLMYLQGNSSFLGLTWSDFHEANQDHHSVS